MKNKCYSIYATHIEEYIQLKHQLGFKFRTGCIILLQIDKLALQRKETTLGINKDFADTWSKKRPNESELYRYERVRYLIKLSAYLQDKGIASYLPKLLPHPKSTFIPYIYSDKEINALFKALDELQLVYIHKSSALFSIPAIIRLLYATGLRISEALALKEEDVNLKDHYLRVRDSKNGKERIIPISESLVKVCKTYKKYRDRLPHKNNKQAPTFFVKINGMPCTYEAVSKWFKKCLKKAAITHTGKLRIHDLRHTFAVNSLASMAQAGLDLYVSLPILSNYLGHQTIESTEHYVRLTASHYPDLIKDVDLICMNVFPKFKQDETN